MRKNNGISKILVGIIILFLALLSIFLIFIFRDNSNIKSLDVALDDYVGDCSGGWTTFSIYQASYNEDSGRIRVYGVTKGSECMSIQLSQSDLNSYLEDEGVEATKGVYGSIRMLKYTKVFPIDKTGYSYPTITASSIGGVLTPCNYDSCIEDYPSTFFYYRDGIFGDCMCVHKEGNGLEGSFSASRSYGDFEVLFTLGSNSVTVTRDQQSATIGNNYIEWTGNLVNLDDVSTPQYDARLISSKWGLVEDGARNSLNIEINDFQQCMIEVSGGGNYYTNDDYEYCKSLFEYESGSILEEKLSDYLNYNSNLIYDANTDDNNLYISLKSTPFPTFILDLDAESVGIVELSGEPEITSCIADQELKSGENKIVNFQVKNNGNADNVQFYARVKCDQGILGYIPNFYINAEETKSINAELIPSNSEQNTLYTSCSLEVFDLKSGDKDTCSFSSSVEYESGITCEPLRTYCDDALQNVVRCNSGGTDKVLYEQCSYGCEYTAEGARCSDSESEEPANFCSDCDAYAKSLILGNFIESQSCESKTFQNGFFCIWAIIRLIAVPIFFILALLLGIQVIGKFMGEKYQIFSWIVSFFLAVLVAVLTYFIFYIGLLIIAIYIIFRFVIKFIPGLNIKGKIKK